MNDNRPQGKLFRLRIWWLLVYLLNTGCVSVSTQTPHLLVLDADNQAEWRARVAPKAGSLALVLAGYSPEACELGSLRIHFAENRDFRTSWSLSIIIKAQFSDNSLKVISEHYRSQTVSYRNYFEGPLLAENPVHIAWDEAGNLFIRVNDQELVQDVRSQRFKHIHIRAEHGISHLSYASSTEIPLQ